MESAHDAVRGVGPTQRTPLPRRAVTAAAATLLLGSGLPGTVASAASTTPQAIAPAAPASAWTTAIQWGAWITSIPAAGEGSDQIATLMREIRRVQAQLDVTQAQLAVLVAVRDEASAQLDNSRAALSRTRSELRAARAALEEAIAENRAARKARKAAFAQRRSARRASSAAEQAWAGSRERLDELTRAADRASARERRRAARVERAEPGSRTWQAAVTKWQLAAVADRAAHARMALFEEQAVDDFVAQQSTEAALTRAEFAASGARRAWLGTRSTKDAARTQEADLVAARAAGRSEVVVDRAALADAEDAVAEKQGVARSLSRRLATLGAQVSAIEDNLAGGR